MKTLRLDPDELSVEAFAVEGPAEEANGAAMAAAASSPYDCTGPNASCGYPYTCGGTSCPSGYPVCRFCS